MKAYKWLEYPSGEHALCSPEGRVIGTVNGYTGEWYARCRYDTKPHKEPFMTQIMAGRWLVEQEMNKKGEEK